MTDREKKKELPEGWVQGKLRDLLSLSYGKSLASSERSQDLHYPVVGSSGVMSRTQTPMVTEPCLVIGRKGNAGSVQVFRDGCWPIDTVFHASPPKELDIDFIAYQLIERKIASLDSSTATPSLRRDDLEEVDLTIPPLAEQRRIVAALEEQLSRLESGLAQITQCTKKAASLKPSILSEVVLNGRHSRRKGWEYKTIGELAKVSTGATPKKSNPEYYSGTIPWVTSTLLNKPVINEADHFITEKALEETSVKLFPPGTLLVAMYGEGKTRGRCSELGIAATTNQACAAILMNEEFDNLQPWVKLYLESSYEENRKLASGGVQPNLNLGHIRSITIPIPPDGERERLLSEASLMKTTAERLESELETAEMRGFHLRRSLLSAAFSGKLVPQDPDDEPASVLLERIRTERAAAPKPKRGRRAPKKTASSTPAPDPQPVSAGEQTSLEF